MPETVITTYGDLHSGDRVRDRQTGWTGRFLRVERYPGRRELFATVIWDHAMSARRIEPGRLEKIA